jgi:rhamnose utilization protein RhaD (predicted bifunctional aldolase and dehydrogenase)
MGLKELVEISNFYGKNPDLVLAGGGNTSYKDKNYLYIKGSGTTLATIIVEGFVKMNRKALADMWKKNYPEDVLKREAVVLSDLMDARAKTDYNKRPSVETSLHDLLPQKYG